MITETTLGFLTPKPSLDSILKAFTTTVVKLNRLIERNTNEATQNAETIISLQASNSALNGETVRASRIRSNLEKMSEA